MAFLVSQNIYAAGFLKEGAIVAEKSSRNIRTSDSKVKIPDLLKSFPVSLFMTQLEM